MPGTVHTNAFPTLKDDLRAVLGANFDEADARICRIIDALDAAPAEASPPSGVYRPTYQQLIDIVDDCQNRRDNAGENSRMMAKWICEGLNALYPDALVNHDPIATSVIEALRPFAACVFNDNGDVTITTSHLRTIDYVRAKLAMRAAEAGSIVVNAEEAALDIESNNAEANKQIAENVLAWLGARDLYDPRDYEEEGPDVDALLTEHEEALQAASTLAGPNADTAYALATTKLFWRRHLTMPRHTAETSLGNYVIEDRGANWQDDRFQLWLDTTEVGAAPSLANAQSEAQQHHDRSMGTPVQTVDPNELANAARTMLHIYNGGERDITGHNREQFNRIIIAGCFAATAYDGTTHPEAANVALVRTFLTAIADPLDNSLDYLRASANSPNNATREPT